MNIREVESDGEIAACYPVMAELRPHLSAEQFSAQVREQMDEGYRLAFLRENGNVCAVAGFRCGRNLAWGRYLYVDDLATRESLRGRGYGSSMLRWLMAQARHAGCDQFHLDSGVQRFAAHGFYLKHRLAITSHHFACVLDND